MKVKVRQDIVYVYSDGKLMFLFIEEDTDQDLLQVTGVPAQRLYQLLEGNQVDELPSEFQEIFSRLIITLIQEGVLAPLEDHQWNNLMPFASEEWKCFGVQGFSGSLIVERLLAAAHSLPGSANFNHGHWNFGGGDCIVFYDADNWQNPDPSNPLGHCPT